MRVPQENFIAGRWLPGTGQRLTSINPADTDDTVFDGPCAGLDQVDQAVEEAARTQERWRRVPAPERARYLGRVASLARIRIDELARAVTREEGKTLADARAEVGKGIDILEYVAGDGWRQPGTMLASDVPGTMAYTRREPLGVVGLITPWNVPFALPCWKLAPALIAGNTAVLKPSNLAPGVALMLAALFEEAGLPPGTLSVVLGSGRVVGRALAAHHRLRGLSFTGSPDARVELFHEVSQRLARFDWMAPEAGGKNAAIVLRDADLELAARGILHGAFASTGQRCTATSRLVVDEGVADALCERLVAGARAIRVGDGRREDTDMGPVIGGAQLDGLVEAVEATRREGTPLVCGGQRVMEGHCGRGFFLAPTIFDQVDNRAPIARRELFGPILTITRVSGFDQALAVANDSPYRLAGALYTRDAATIMRYVEHAEARMLHINAPTIGGEPHQPYGGVRCAGRGELTHAGLDFFSEPKVVFLDHGAGERRPPIYY